jgi:hypothetical protein
MVLALLLAAASTALASEPKQRINPADQARARAMLLKQADVGIGYRAVRTGSSAGADVSCTALDDSDLTVTGEADSPKLTSGLQTIGSIAEIYATVRDANASWRRITSAAAFQCIADTLRRIARSTGLHHVSFRKVPFPALAPRTIAYRWQVLAGGVRVYTDFVFLMRGRAQATTYFVSGIDPLERPEELRLARLVSNRMAKVMRGA